MTVSLSEEFNELAAGLREVLPDLSVKTIKKAGFNPVHIPLLQDEFWWDKRQANNCYNFAINHPGNDMLKPGALSWTKRGAFMTAFNAATFNRDGFREFERLVREGMKRDGWYGLGDRLDPASIPSGGKENWLAALFLADVSDLEAVNHRTEKGHDFHFYALRRISEKSGEFAWAHKVGTNPVSTCRNFNPAASRSDIIFRDAHERGYRRFAGFYLVNRPDSPLY